MKRTRLAAIALAALLLAGCAAPAGNSSDSSSSPPSASTSASTPSSSGNPVSESGVRVDWSRLEQANPVRQANKDGGRWYAGAITELIPSAQYGPLIPYVGSVVYPFDSWIDENGQEQTYYSYWATPLYGLMTREGRIVTDPIYLSAFQPSFRWQGKTNYLPVLILSQAREEWTDLNNGRRYGVAALDGSWCTDFDFWMYTAREDELILVGPAGLTWMDAASGNRIDWDWAFLGISEEELPQIVEQLLWAFGLQWLGEGVFLGLENPDDWENSRVRMFQPETLELSWISMDDYTAAQDWFYEQRNENVNAVTWEYQVVGDQFIFRSGQRSYALTPPMVDEDMSGWAMGDLAIVNHWTGSENRSWLFRLSTQELLFEGTSIDFVYDNSIENPAPYVNVIESGGKAILYAPDLTPLLIHHLTSSSDWISYTVQDGLIYAQYDLSFFGCYDCHTGSCIFYRNLTLGD